MRTNIWPAGIILVLVIALFSAACDKKTTQPEETFDVINDNEYCGLVAGYISGSDGIDLSNVRVSISPVPTARLGDLSSSAALSSFINYPNPFTTDTHFTYYLSGSDEHTVTIRVYDLQHNLLRRFDGIPGTGGAHLFYFDGLDDQDESLPGGLMPCEIITQSTSGTDSLRIALAKDVNISDQGGLESYTVTAGSDGKYIIDDVPLDIRLLQTTIFAPLEEWIYPSNWPYMEIEWMLTNRFIVSANKTGYAIVSDTVTLNPGGVARLDLTLR